jgi:hypothetical protein
MRRLVYLRPPARRRYYFNVTEFPYHVRVGDCEGAYRNEPAKQATRNEELIDKMGRQFTESA